MWQDVILYLHKWGFDMKGLIIIFLVFGLPFNANSYPALNLFMLGASSKKKSSGGGGGRGGGTTINIPPGCSYINGRVWCEETTTELVEKEHLDRGTYDYYSERDDKWFYLRKKEDKWFVTVDNSTYPIPLKPNGQFDLDINHYRAHKNFDYQGSYRPGMRRVKASGKPVNCGGFQ